MGALRGGARFGRGQWIAIALVAILLAAFLPPLIAWQRRETAQARSLSNLRRLATGLLQYAQDWDGRLMPPAQQQPGGSWWTWPQAVRPYITAAATFSNPANPASYEQPSARHPQRGYLVRSSYALNRRFWNTFSPGPFPLENLELAAQTVLLVEAGPMWPAPRQRPARPSPLALLDYGDTTDRVSGFCPYPSPHSGYMALVSADGHAEMVYVEHYSPAEGPRDRLYGRIGGRIYNWNGGHPNGATDRPPRE